MGFRTNSYAKVWKVEPKSDTWTKLSITVSRKNNSTGEFEKEFSGFVDCFGSAVAAKAAALKEGDSIKIGDVDVTNSYDSEKKITYTNYKMFSFENADKSASQPNSSAAVPADPVTPESEGDIGDDRLPF